MKTLIAMHQHQGDREYQQDIMARKSYGSAGTLCVLADGMGGYEGGEIASRLIRDTFMKMSIDSDDIGVILEKTLYNANSAIAEYKKDHPEVKSMGSTAVAVFLTESTMQWISVGDSLLYGVINCKHINRINENHSIAGLLQLQLKKNEITKKEYEENPNKHMLTSALTGEEISMIDVSKVKSRKENHIYIVASDGIETLSETETLGILQRYDCNTQAGLNEASVALIDAVLAKKKRNQDNVTVILISGGGITQENISYSKKAVNSNLSIEKEKRSLTSIMRGSIIISLIALLSFLIILIGKNFFDEGIIAENNDTNNKEPVEQNSSQKNTSDKSLKSDMQKKSQANLETGKSSSTNSKSHKTKSTTKKNTSDKSSTPDTKKKSHVNFQTGKDTSKNTKTNKKEDIH